MENNNMNRRQFLGMTGSAIASVSLSSYLLGTACSSKGGRPNIIFIMSDDHASQAIGCYGSVLNQTPNLDRIAQNGMKFNHCFCVNSICAPSRATILTGKYSHKNGVVDNASAFDGSQQTFPKMLQRAGYKTGMIGKWHLRSDPTGFDYWNILPGQGAYYNPLMIEMGEKKQYTGYTTDLITEMAVDYLEENAKGNQPFFLMFHHKAPHRNWQPPPRYLRLYDNVTFPLPETFWDDYSTRSAAAHDQHMSIAKDLIMDYDLKIGPPPKNLNAEQKQAWLDAYGPKIEAFKRERPTGKDLVRWKYQRYLEDYLACIAAVDDSTGKILDYLREMGLENSTLVLYTSDQGFYLGEHGWFDKRFMYEESLRMPLLVQFPELIEPGTVNDDIVLNIDFASTFLELAGSPVPPDLQGRSLKPLLAGRTPEDWRKAMYYHYYEYPDYEHMVKRHYGIRTERYKLIHFYYDIDAWEFYDLAKDPHEQNNVYDNPEYAGIISDLKSQLQQLRKQYGDSDVLTRKILNDFLVKDRLRKQKNKKK